MTQQLALIAQRDIVEGVSAPPTDLADDVFSYDHVTPEVAKIARVAADLVRTHQTDAAIWCGKQLAKAKDALGHGHFGRWIRDELGMTPRTAQNLISVAEQFGAKAKSISHIPQTVLYTLASPTTPDEVRNEVLDRIDRGEQMSTRNIKDLVADRKAELAEQARVAKLTKEQRVKEMVKVRRSKAAREKHKEEWRLLEEQRNREQRARVTTLVGLLRGKLTDDEIHQAFGLCASINWYMSGVDLKAVLASAAEPTS